MPAIRKPYHWKLFYATTAKLIFNKGSNLNGKGPVTRVGVAFEELKE